MGLFGNKDEKKSGVLSMMINGAADPEFNKVWKNVRLVVFVTADDIEEPRETHTLSGNHMASKLDARVAVVRPELDDNCTTEEIAMNITYHAALLDAVQVLTQTDRPFQTALAQCLMNESMVKAGMLQPGEHMSILGKFNLRKGENDNKD